MVDALGKNLIKIWRMDLIWKTWKPRDKIENYLVKKSQIKKSKKKSKNQDQNCITTTRLM